MTRTLRPLVGRPVHRSYKFLSDQFPLRPLRSEPEYDVATAALDRLVLREDSLDEGERDYLGTLELLIEAYEDEHYAADASPDPLAALKFLMHENGMSATDLGALLGSKGTASEILNGKKLMSRAAAFKLAERFSVEPGLFFQPPRRRYPSKPARA